MLVRRSPALAIALLALATLAATPARADETVEALAERVIATTAERLGDRAAERVAEAVAFARRAHDGQVRDGGEPFVTHVLRVAASVAGSPDRVSVEMIQAAVLHDTVEDTEVRLEELRRRFGDRVARHVHELTLDPLERFGGDKEARDRAYYERFASALRGSHVIKLHDRFDNVNDMRAWPLEGRLGYLAKTRAVLIPALERHSPDLATRLAAEVDRIEASVNAEWERVARLTIPELLARARKQTGRSDLPIERAALVSIITGTEKARTAGRIVELQRTASASPARPRPRTRGFLDAMRDQVRSRRGRARARR